MTLHGPSFIHTASQQPVTRHRATHTLNRRKMLHSKAVSISSLAQQPRAAYKSSAITDSLPSSYTDTVSASSSKPTSCSTLAPTPLTAGKPDYVFASASHSTSSINFKPVSISFDEPQTAPSIITSDDVITIYEAKKSKEDCASISPSILTTQTSSTAQHTHRKKKKVCSKLGIPAPASFSTPLKRSHSRYYRNHSNAASHKQHEIWELAKWCVFCLAALGSCLVFLSYLLQITGSPHASSSAANSRAVYRTFVPHHAAHSLANHHNKLIYSSAKLQGSVASSYVMNRKSSALPGTATAPMFSHRIPIHHGASHSHSEENAMPARYNVIEKQLKLQNINLNSNTNMNANADTNHDSFLLRGDTKKSNENDKQYLLVRNDKYSILNDVLFLVFRGEHQMDGREHILKTWAKPYRGTYDIHIKFVNTRRGQFGRHADGSLFDDVIEPPFIHNGDDDVSNAMCLLWAMDEYTDGFKWIFKLHDDTFVMIENLVDYLNEIELESHHRELGVDSNTEQRTYYWWLGNRLQQTAHDETSVFTSGGAGYLLNRAVLDLIVDDIRKYDEIHSNHDENRFEKYMMCHKEKHNKPQLQTDDDFVLYDDDLCIAYLLNVKYQIQCANTLDMDKHEKFNEFDPITLLGLSDKHAASRSFHAYKSNVGQASSERGLNHISKTPITFHRVAPDWMLSYYQLLYLHKNSKDIASFAAAIGDATNAEHASKYKRLNKYAQIVTQYSLINHIKNIDNEMQHLTANLHYNLVK